MLDANRVGGGEGWVLFAAAVLKSSSLTVRIQKAA